MITSSAENINLYQCLVLPCQQFGLTDRSENLHRELHGYLCPSCASQVVQDNIVAIFCTHCRAITTKLEAPELQIMSNVPDDHILFSDHCPNCCLENSSISLRYQLAPDQ